MLHENDALQIVSRTRCAIIRLKEVSWKICEKVILQAWQIVLRTRCAIIRLKEVSWKVCGKVILQVWQIVLRTRCAIKNIIILHAKIIACSFDVVDGS